VWLDREDKGLVNISAKAEACKTEEQSSEQCTGEAEPVTCHDWHRGVSEVQVYSCLSSALDGVGPCAWPLYLQEGAPIPILQEAEWAHWRTQRVLSA
jgi:hypothetical protein